MKMKTKKLNIIREIQIRTISKYYPTFINVATV